MFCIQGPATSLAHLTFHQLNLLLFWSKLSIRLSITIHWPSNMAAHNPAPLDLKNVQGDILYEATVGSVTLPMLICNRLNGLPKKTEICFFFQIDKDHVKEFRTQLDHLVPLITSTTQVANDRDKIAQSKRDSAERKYDPPLLELTGVNIAFSSKGIVQVSPLPHRIEIEA